MGSTQGAAQENPGLGLVQQVARAQAEMEELRTIVAEFERASKPTITETAATAENSSVMELCRAAPVSSESVIKQIAALRRQLADAETAAEKWKDGCSPSIGLAHTSTGPAHTSTGLAHTSTGLAHTLIVPAHTSTGPAHARGYHGYAAAVV